MKLSERSYVGSDSFRPKPYIHPMKHPNGYIVITPWGKTNEDSKLLAQIIHDQIEIGFNPDATNPFEYYPHLGPIGNLLKTSLNLVNNYIIKTQNQSEFSFGVEILVLILDKKEVHWGAVGFPHLFLKSSRDLIPLHYPPHWTHSIQKKYPLPSDMLGLHNPFLPHLGSLPYDMEHDSLLLISRSWIPRSFYGLVEYHIQSIQECLIEENSNEPFWLGVLDPNLK